MRDGRTLGTGAGTLGASLLAISILAASATSGCVGDIGDGSGVGTPPGVTENFQPQAPVMRRLLARQYLNSVADLLGEDAAAAAVAPDDQPINGFDAIGASQFNVGDAAVVDYEKSARTVAAAAITGPRVREYLACTPTGATDAACFESFVKAFGRVAFRRSLAADETADYVAVAIQAGEAYSSFDRGMEHAIAAMLQSPSFLYQIELGQPVEGYPGFRQLTGVEMATRLSFFLLDTTPSAELLDLAEAGGLDGDVREVASAMVERAEAKQAVRALYDEVLHLRGLPEVVKSIELYPEFSPEVAQAMREETLRLLDDIVWTRDADFTEMLTASYTFVDPQLAAIYGLPPPEGGEWARADWPADQPRAGFLTQGAFLAAESHIELTSPTLRGKFIRERLLCQAINPPPNNVVTEFPDDEGLVTMREKLQAHQEIPSCAGCHIATDVPGLAFESFDAIGAYRELDQGKPIDPSGSLDDRGSFADAKELAGLLAEHPGLVDCSVRNLYRASLGHVESDGEEAVIVELTNAFAGDGRRLKTLLVELASSDAFRFVGDVQ